MEETKVEELHPQAWKGSNPNVYTIIASGRDSNFVTCEMKEKGNVKGEGTETYILCIASVQNVLATSILVYCYTELN
jgi:hypothetical protein